jgi:hypothetical protein
MYYRFNEEAPKIVGLWNEKLSDFYRPQVFIRRGNFLCQDTDCIHLRLGRTKLFCQLGCGFIRATVVLMWLTIPLEQCPDRPATLSLGEADGKDRNGTFLGKVLAAVNVAHGSHMTAEPGDQPQHRAKNVEYGTVLQHRSKAFGVIIQKSPQYIVIVAALCTSFKALGANPRPTRIHRPPGETQ